MGRKGYGLDYAALLAETESLMEAQGLALTSASQEIGEQATERHSLGENAAAESIARNIRRHYRKKHGPSRKERLAERAPSVYPGLGVFYDALEDHLPAIERASRGPLSAQQRRDLEAVCEEVVSRLVARLEALSEEPPDLERQVQRDVIDLHALMPPGELIVREHERIRGLLPRFAHILATKNTP